MNISESMMRRYSVRKYSNIRVDEDTLNKIHGIVDEAKKLYENIELKISLVREGEKIHEISKGIIGSYGKIEAPHYLILTSEEKEGYLENAGYYLENIVLEMTKLKLGTCWIGGFIKKELLNSIIDIPENQVPIIVIAFGYEELVKDMDTVHRSRKRKDLKDIVKGDLDGEWEEIFKLVRIAPSAVNLQPWRFYKDNNLIHVYREKRGLLTKKLEFMNKIDIGIALSHLVLACNEKGKKIHFKNEYGKEIKGLHYVITGYEE